MGIAQKSETFVSPEDHRWLGKTFGTDSMNSETLDVDAFLAADWADGDIPSGVALGKITASGLLAPYDDGAVDGTEDCVGFLGHSKSLGTDAGQQEPCAVLWRGQVVVAYLPDNHGADAAVAADLPHVAFVGALA